MPTRGEPKPPGVSRRTFLGASLAALATTAIAPMLGACSSPTDSTTARGDAGAEETGQPPMSNETPRESSAPKVLVAYFSRPGENYYYGDRTWLDVGNTEVVANTIADMIACDVHKIEPADPYPNDYDQTVRRNVDEQNRNARPAIANPLPDLASYDVVLLGSPIWNLRAPMIMSTFTEALDFTGRTVHPFTTHAMSGLGSTEEDYAKSCTGAKIGEGAAIQGERANEARPDLATWLRRIGLAAER